MTNEKDTRATYAEYLAGKASFADLESAAERTLSRFNEKRDSSRQASSRPQSPQSAASRRGRTRRR